MASTTGGNTIRTVSKLARLTLLILIGVLVLVVGVCALLNLRTPSETDLAKSAQLSAPPEPLKEPVILNVVTFNICGLYYKGQRRSHRMPAIGKTLAALDPDLIGLQEAFIEKDREQILRELAETGLTYHRYFPSGLVGSGLLVISRYPIVETFFHRYSRGGKPYKVWHGDWWAGKGVGLARIALPDNTGYVDFFNTHAHARYGSTEYDDTRLSQMTELAEFIAEASTDTSPTLLVGDVNCLPKEEQHRTLVENAKLERLMTLDSRNDHIFGVTNPRYAFEVIDTQPIEATLSADGVTFGLSDHKGYFSVIRITPLGDGVPLI